jgi:hypothetical protein
MRTLQDRLRQMGPLPFTLVTLAIIVVIGVRYWGPQHAATGLDAELNFPAYFSAAVLVVSGFLTLVVATTWPPRSRARRLFVGLALFLAFFSLDELLSVHERLESFTGIDWQKLYLPVGAIGALIGLGVLLEVRRDLRVVATLLAAGAAWFVAQVFEAIQWKGDKLVVPWLIYPEELLEMTGSALFGVAMLMVLRSDRLRCSHPEDRVGAGRLRDGDSDPARRG